MSERGQRETSMRGFSPILRPMSTDLSTTLMRSGIWKTIARWLLGMRLYSYEEFLYTKCHMLQRHFLIQDEEGGQCWGVWGWQRPPLPLSWCRLLSWRCQDLRWWRQDKKRGKLEASYEIERGLLCHNNCGDVQAMEVSKWSRGRAGDLDSAKSSLPPLLRALSRWKSLY